MPSAHLYMRLPAGLAEPASLSDIRWQSSGIRISGTYELGVPTGMVALTLKVPGWNSRISTSIGVKLSALTVRLVKLRNSVAISENHRCKELRDRAEQRLNRYPSHLCPADRDLTLLYRQKLCLGWPDYIDVPEDHAWRLLRPWRESRSMVAGNFLLCE